MLWQDTKRTNDSFVSLRQFGKSSLGYHIPGPFFKTDDYKTEKANRCDNELINTNENTVNWNQRANLVQMALLLYFLFNGDYC